jgi:hypothetical protein
LKHLTEIKGPDLLIVSASLASSPRTVTSYQAELERVAKGSGVEVILGGDGPWKPSDVAVRVDSFLDLETEVRKKAVVKGEDTIV